MLFKAKFINGTAMEKSKKYPTGTIRDWNGKKYQKQSDGEWKEVKKGRHKNTAQKKTDIDNSHWHPTNIDREIDVQHDRVQEAQRLYNQALAQRDDNRANQIYASVERARGVLAAMEEYRDKNKKRKSKSPEIKETEKQIKALQAEAQKSQESIAYFGKQGDPDTADFHRERRNYIIQFIADPDVKKVRKDAHGGGNEGEIARQVMRILGEKIPNPNVASKESRDYYAEQHRLEQIRTEQNKINAAKDKSYHERERKRGGNARERWEQAKDDTRKMYQVLDDYGISIDEVKSNKYKGVGETALDKKDNVWKNGPGTLEEAIEYHGMTPKDVEYLKAGIKVHDKLSKLKDAAYAEAGQGRLFIKSHIQMSKAELEKAKAAPVGTTADWGGKKYKKESAGVWKPIGGERPGGGGGYDAGQKHPGEDIKTSSDLHKKFMDTLARMTDKGRAVFRGGKYDVKNKQFVSPDGKFALKYENGEVGVVNLKKSRPEVEWFEKSTKPSEKQIEKFIANNKTPDDKKGMHAWAERHGWNPHKTEEAVYAYLGSFVGAGKSKGKHSAVDAEQLRMGIKVEMEHTTSRSIAEKIARDHLMEMPDYYTRLKKMEGGDCMKKSIFQRAKARLVLWKGMTPHMTSLDTGNTNVRVHASHAEEHPDDDIGEPYHSRGAGNVPKLKKKAVPSPSTSESAEDEVKKSKDDITYILKSENGRAVIVLNKSKKYPTGTIRTWNGIKYQKQANGEWHEVKKGRGGVKKKGQVESDTPQPSKGEKWVVDTPTMKAGPWHAGTHNGEAMQFQEVYEKIGGRWEGYVSMRKPKPAPAKAEPRMTESKYSDLNFKSSSSYVDYLESTLIPDLEVSGSYETAKDFKEGVHWMKKQLPKERKPMKSLLPKMMAPINKEHFDKMMAVDSEGDIQTISSKLLSASTTGGVDLNRLAAHELAGRGQNKLGKWIGFDAAKKEHKIKDDEFPERNSKKENMYQELSTVPTPVLAAAVRGEFDMNKVAMRELRNRGMDENGKWVGFDENIKKK